MPNNHTVIFLKTEEYQYKTNIFELLTDFLKKGGKFFLHINMLKEDNAYPRNTGFGEKLLKRQLNLALHWKAHMNSKWLCKEKFLLCLVGTSHHCISLLLKGA